MKKHNVLKEKCILLIFGLIISFYFITILNDTFQARNASFADVEKQTGIVNKFKAFQSAINLRSTEELRFRMKHVEFNGVFSKAIGKNYFIESSGMRITKLKNDYFLEITVRKNKKRIDHFAQKIIDYKEYNEKQGIPTMYVQAPCKLSPDKEMLPEGVKDYSNDNADQMVSFLRKGNVDVLDIREKMLHADNDYYEFFYKTDHHWTVDASLWATQVIAEKLNQTFNMSIDTDALDRDKFNADTIKDTYLGSLGRRLSLSLADKEDFTFLSPKYSTNLNFIDIDASATRNNTGSFDEIMYKHMPEDKNVDIYSIPTPDFTYYLYGTSPLKKVRNLKQKNNQKVLFIGESFSLATTAFMSLGAEEVDLLDLRYYKDSVKEYVHKTKPDVVVIMYYPITLRDSNPDSVQFRFE